MLEVNEEHRIAVYSSGATVYLYRYISVIHFFTASYSLAQLVKVRHKKSKVTRSTIDGVIRTFYSYNTSASYN